MYPLVEHYFPGVDSDELTDDELVEYYAKALWLEDRQINNMAAAISRAFAGE